MTDIRSLGIYLPPGEVSGRRGAGPGEDVLTMAVVAGRAADPGASAQRVVVVSRDFLVSKGGNAAALLARLSLPANVAVDEVVGGAPAVLEQILGATDGTLVLAIDDAPTFVGAAAVLVGSGPGRKGESGTTLTPVAWQTRRLLTAVRVEDGVPDEGLRLQDAEVKSAIAKLGLKSRSVHAVVGAKATELGGDVTTIGAIEDPVSSASGVIQAMVRLIQQWRGGGRVLAVERASVTAADLRASFRPPMITFAEPGSTPPSRQDG